jgi:hypothetical protein
MPSLDHHQLEQLASAVTRYENLAIHVLIAYKTQPAIRKVLGLHDTVL